MAVSTDLSSATAVEIRKSRIPDDAACENPQYRSSLTIDPSNTRRVEFNFARQIEPGIALYEWHVCFVIAGTTYRAWRGYDPGPGATLNAMCIIDTRQIQAKDATKYLCPDVEVAPNRANYAEYAVATPTTWTPEPCLDVRTYAGAGSRGEECLRLHGASDGASGGTVGTEYARMTVRTNSSSPLDVTYRMSRTPNDFDCRQAQVTHVNAINRFTLGPSMSKEISFFFHRQIDPGIALYEWHVCFVIGQTVYRAWRGYDPGPGSWLGVDRLIDRALLQAKDTTKYLCGATEVGFNPDDYSEYAAYCAEGECHRFEIREQYEPWWSLGNPLTVEEQNQLAEDALKYALTHDTYLSANAKDFPFYLTVRGRDPSPEFLARVSAVGIVFTRGSEMAPLPRDVIIVTGRRNMHVYIGEFEIVEPGVARAGLGASCAGLCGSSSVVTARKQNDHWEIEPIRLTSIQ